MPIARLVIILSALLVISPMMSQLAMASASHSSPHNSMTEDKTMNEHGHDAVDEVAECTCCEDTSSQYCSGSMCVCDACVSVYMTTYSQSHNTASLQSNIARLSRTLIDITFSVTVPPPIEIL